MLNVTPRNVLSLVTALCLGAIGGAIADYMGGPMPWLLGSLLLNAAWVLIFPGKLNPVWFPMQLRSLFVVIIGVMIGALFTPELVRSLPQWWPGILGVIAYTMVLHLCVFVLYRRVGRLDATTAFFAASPGGFIENILIGEAEGGDVRKISLLQFLRIVMVVTAIPFGFLIWTGQSVGSAAGTTLAVGTIASSTFDYLMLFAAGGLGFLIGIVFRIPAGQVVGPIAVSALFHMSGVSVVQLPNEASQIAQVAIGASLGVRFAGLRPVEIASSAALCLCAVTLALALAVSLGVFLSIQTGESPELYVMSFAPAGVIEMSLVALTLGANPVFVTTHHVIRLCITVLVMPPLYRRWFAPP